MIGRHSDGIIVMPALWLTFYTILYGSFLKGLCVLMKIYFRDKNSSTCAFNS